MSRRKPHKEWNSNRGWLRSLRLVDFDVLTPRDFNLLSWRYGLMDGGYCTLEEVGVRLGLSRERTRVLEARAIKRLIAQTGTLPWEKP